MNMNISVKTLGLFLGPLLCFGLLASDVDFISPAADKVLAIAVWMVLWWISEAVSISVTALLPLVLFPLLGINDFKSVAGNYGSAIIFLFLGGFILALAMEKCALHKRIALTILTLTGNRPQGILLGLMLSTGFLSMWISNTATTLVILPIALTIVSYIADLNQGVGGAELAKFRVACMLGIAYAANIGGTATLIGTPPNVVLVGYMEERLGLEMDFMQWLGIALPFAVLLFLATYAVLSLFFLRGLRRKRFSIAIVHQERSGMGALSYDELLVMACFGITIALWIFRVPFNARAGLSLGNAHIAMIGALLTFVLPSTKRKMGKLLEWEDTKELQWGILILFGGGLALANALSDAGIVTFIGDYVHSQNYGQAQTQTMLVSLSLFLTELMSNVALVSILSPMLSGIATGVGMDFLHLGIPVALASSCAFMLPMSTPPNAIVYSSGFLRVIDMLKVGVVLNIIAIFLLIVLGNFWIVIFV